MKSHFHVGEAHVPEPGGYLPVVGVARRSNKTFGEGGKVLPGEKLTSS